jgi:5-methylthioadenosine/S-adenosylhomocysteine deaminase
MTVRPGTVTIIRGGRLLDARAHRADPGDILVTGDTISEIGPPSLAAPAGAVTINARSMLLHPGLVNAHTHAHGNLAKGMGDRWTLELLLTAAPWINGNRSAEDRHLSAKIGRRIPEREEGRSPSTHRQAPGAVPNSCASWEGER